MQIYDNKFISQAIFQNFCIAMKVATGLRLLKRHSKLLFLILKADIDRNAGSLQNPFV